MKIVAISDLHGHLPENLPESSLLLIAGDVFPLRIQEKLSKCEKWLKDDFHDWFYTHANTQQCVMIAGNHDWYPYFYKKQVKNIFSTYFNQDIIYLHNEIETININGEDLTIYGTPWCHRFGDWAFMDDDDKLEEYFKVCPDKVDIILAHDAPYGVTDICLDARMLNKGNLGSHPLRNLIERVDFKYLFHGHLHSSDHQLTQFKNGLVCNVSLLDENYKPTYYPIEIEYGK